ncbi:MAG: M50 family metallopeptidase [Myxococcota bacterium]
MFRLFDIPIRVHPFFFITAVFIGLQTAHAQWLERLMIWIPLMFLGVLLHELGHALAGRAFGLVPSIELYALGGLTWWQEGKPLGPWRSIFVSLAGPMVGIAIGLAGLAALWSSSLPEESLQRYALLSLVWVNLGWGLLNLLPMLPLDGGNVMASFFELVAKKNGRRFARYLSIAVAAALAAWALAASQIFAVLLLAFLAWNNIRDLRSEKQMRALLPYRGLLEKAYAGLAEGDSLRVLGAAQELASADHPQVQAEGQLLLAWGRLLRGDTFGARAATDAIPGVAGEDSALQGALLLADGDEEGALRHFEVVGAEPVEQARLGAAFMATDRYDVAAKLFESEAARQVPAAVVERLSRAAADAGRGADAERLRRIHAKL